MRFFIYEKPTNVALDFRRISRHRAETSALMALMILSVSSFASRSRSHSAIALMVSVTDAGGFPYSGLLEVNFTVRWIHNTNIDQPVGTRTFKEYTAANGLPALPGVYLIELTSEQIWSQIATFYIAVSRPDKGDRGQILYRMDDSSFRQMNP
ncbi:MAG: hypothetical protein ABI895_43550 [Deltaproteobacteria bacterium]